MFGIFVNPIMWKGAPLIISSESNLAEELAPCANKTKRTK